MSKRFVLSLAAGAVALTAAMCAAEAAPLNPSATITTPAVQNLAVPVRFGGGGGFGGGGFHGGGFGGFHGGGFHSGGFHGGAFNGGGFRGGGLQSGLRGGHFASHSNFHGHALARSHFSQGRHFHHGHGHGHHHRHRFFIGGYPYFYYDGYYDDGYYGDDCWWSRRHHRWVCPDY